LEKKRWTDMGGVPVGTWESFENRYRITGVLVADTALRVGCGSDTVEPAAADLPVFREGEVPVIPGSSLRGAVRAHLERLFRTLEPNHGEGRGACNLLDDDACCVSTRRYQEFRAGITDPGELHRKVYEKSCRICRLFGSPWVASRVRFSDAIPDGQVSVSRRDGVSIDREKETVHNKYDFEVVDRGARFSLEILADNLRREEHEPAVLFLALREMEQGHIMLGGFKGRGLGRVRLEETRVEMVDGRDRTQLLDFVARGVMRQVQREEIDASIRALMEYLGRVD
jgi:CRISPR-associated RAMP protein (TIGR02581 family)